MTSVTPLYLPNVDSSASDTFVTYKYRTTTGDFHIYSQEYNSGSSNGTWRSQGDHDIKVRFQPTTASDYDVWVDAGNLNPASFTVSNGVVYL